MIVNKSPQLLYEAQQQVNPWLTGGRSAGCFVTQILRKHDTTGLTLERGGLFLLEKKKKKIIGPKVRQA